MGRSSDGRLQKMVLAKNFVNNKNNFYLPERVVWRWIEMQAESFWRRQED
jgi:hypothetical protein